MAKINCEKKPIAETLICLCGVEDGLRGYLDTCLNEECYAHLRASLDVRLETSRGEEKRAYIFTHNADFAVAHTKSLAAAVNDYLKKQEATLNAGIEAGVTVCVELKMAQKEKEAVPSSEKKTENVTEAALSQFVPIEPKWTLDQVILPADVKDEIVEAINLMKYQELIYDEWGFRKTDPVPKSVLNFYGPPGTGKTMCAHAVARVLGRKLLACNYAQIESKYVGEAAKNLAAAFECAAASGSVLFFDEADSFLGRRIENVTQGADQALNSLRSQMLIFLENFHGVVLFATNLVRNFDQAFESRILKHIQFPLPNREARAQIIANAIPENLPFENGKTVSDEEVLRLSDIADGFSGREIKGAVLECMLRKATRCGRESVFTASDFEDAFRHKVASMEALREERERKDREKIVKAMGRKIKEENKQETEQGRKLRLICVVAETGLFFAQCDGTVEEAEKNYVTAYLENLKKSQQISEKEAEEIEKKTCQTPTFEHVLEQTKELLGMCTGEGERDGMVKMLSFFINDVICADGVIDAKEEHFYTLWKQELKAGDNIDIADML